MCSAGNRCPMMQYLLYGSKALGLGTIALQVSFIVLLVAFVFPSTTLARRIRALVRDYGLHLGFAIALLGLLGSLFYSQALGFAPCVLCWYARIVLYPQVVLFAVGIWRRDYGVVYTSIPLSLFGLIIGAYQYLTQITPLTLNGICSIGEGEVSCSVRY